MRRSNSAYMGFVCVFLGALFQVIGGPLRADLALAAPLAMGGERAFATKADGMVSTIESFIQAENYKAAEEASLELTRDYPEYMQGWILLGYCRSRAAKFELSNAAYDIALELGADPVVILTRKGYNYIRLGQFDTARTSYLDLLELSPEDIGALKQLGYIEGKVGKYDMAAHYYNKVLRIEPQNKEVMASLAKIETKRGGNNAVKDLLRKQLEMDPEDSEALGRLGLIYIKEKNFKAALEPLRTLVLVEPDNVKAHRNLGVAYYQLGDKANARESFKRVHELGGPMSDLYGSLADCYLATKNRADAMDVIRDGIANGSTEKARLYCLWGNILEDQKNYDGATAKFNSAARLGEEPWSGYARKQISRQAKLKKRQQMISSQGMQ